MSERLPVVHLVNTVRGGSHGHIMNDLAAVARSVGYDAAISYGRGPASPGRIGSRLDGAAHLALTRLLDNHGFSSTRATRAFVARLKADPPDLLHLHNMHGYYLNVGILFDYIRASGIPTVLTLHDCWTFTGHCSHFVRAHCDKWRDGCRDCPMKREYPASYLLDRSRYNYMRKKYALTRLNNLWLATPSQWLAGLAGQSYLKDYNITVIPNGVDLSVFRPAETISDPAARQIILAAAAPFDHRKGIDDTISVARSIPEADTIMVGLTASQIKALPQLPNIRGIERTSDRAALVELYRRASVLINTTYEDTYPTVNMEAMACGTPVAAYDTGGCGEQITPATGRIVRVGDTIGMTAVIRSLLDEPRKAIRETCRAHAETNFDRRNAMQSYMDLYRSILRNNGASHAR